MTTIVPRCAALLARLRPAALAAVLIAWLSIPACAQTAQPVTLPSAPASAVPNPNAPRDTGLVRVRRASPEPEPPGIAADAVASTSAVSTSAAFRVERRMEMRSTAYCLRGMMRTGVRVRDGMAAADPSVLPLGSVVRVSHPDGRLIGVFVVMDTGGAVRGNKLDLWFSDCGEASDWGTRRVVAEVIDIGRS
ncbi:3D domain-containing protein [Longimicrobium terrae]|uniref:3D (Asp-Asp-Asp) domain-containing protein n=1 Tax=Longimicrobium terrae TaxID=1639882 RepID=A0A841H1N7_9BACT|nr:3D domain-containing protein [Longimicrobium terrae]MBB4637458.1 3D (Asp-Asp-Asp) domain-containing protein [Longimicrobium terrae]MBB6071856.1 3D (Asp-Asp-Asp) domain-containing protein [Longimicrobium terrae]NNC30405.1 3D domain-containing protein [Longimicrobium terrae]